MDFATPQSRDANKGYADRYGERPWRNLNDQVLTWPTPVADGDRTTNYAHGGTSLGFAARNWPTPTASSGTGAGAHGDGGVNLQTAVKYPSPNASDWKDSGASQGRRKSPNLGTVVHYPTPKTNGFCGGSGSAGMVRGNDSLSDAEKRSMLAGNGGQLNPDWVEWLMGWPVGHTDRDRADTEWRDWQRDPADDPGDIPRIATRKDGRVARLKAIGNGQVPLCAAAMWSWGLAVIRGVNG